MYGLGMSVWVVSMMDKDLSRMARFYLKRDVTHTVFTSTLRDGTEQVRYDVEESEFFQFKERMDELGISLPTDGGDSWAKAV